MKSKILILELITLNLLAGCTSPLNSKESSLEIQIDRIKSTNDQDGDGVDDFTDIVESARSQIGVVTEYDTTYYPDAYPPPQKGACADVIWRALQTTGYDFKKDIDQDMKKHPEDYPSNPKPDTKINFRRVQNIRVYLSKFAESLTTQVIPGNKENLTIWQGGDIVTFDQIPGGLWHVAVVSSKRRPDGVPLLIHNYGRGVQEDDYLLTWPTQISGHFRINDSKN